MSPMKDYDFYGKKQCANNHSQQPRIKQDRGGGLKPKGACTNLDNGSPADTLRGSEKQCATKEKSE